MVAARAPRTRHVWLVGLLIGCAVRVVVGGGAAAYAPEDPFAAYVNFAASVPYSAAPQRRLDKRQGGGIR